MRKYVAIGACVVGIAILHSVIVAHRDRSGELPKLTNSRRNMVVSPGGNPAYSGVLFVGGEVSSIPSLNLPSLPPVVDRVPTVEPSPLVTALPPEPLPAPPAQVEPPPVAPQPELPPPPVVAKPVPPSLEAEKIKVMGAMAIGGKNYAIVSVPGGTTQYVTEGERLVDNKVLVKTIALAERPLVILEQNNTEFPHTLDQGE